MLLSRHPPAVQAPTQDGKGYLPLHVAAEAGAPASVMQRLVSDWPSACSRKTSTGYLPLHLVCLKGNSRPAGELKSIVETLVQQHPAACTCLAPGDSLPVHLALVHSDIAELPCWNDVIAVLLEKEHVISCRMRDGETGGSLFHQAIKHMKHGHTEEAKQLHLTRLELLAQYLPQGRALEFKDHKGKSVRTVAMDHPLPHVSEWALTFGAFLGRCTQCMACWLHLVWSGATLVLH
jgi:hypothetical protein